MTYQYAPNGLRTQKASGGVTIDYLLDSQSDYGDVIAEYANGTKAKTYTIGDDLISQTQGQATFYYGYDGLGSTRMLFADTGAVTDSYDYTAFGEIHGETGTTDNTFLFTGEQYDSNVGQYYLRARYYNQTIGRFTQMDTYQGSMSDPASLHKYLYTGNNPVNMVDPSGHFGVSLGGVSISLSIGSTLSAMGTGLSLWGAFDTGYMVGEFMSGQRSLSELSPKEIGISILMMYAGNRIAHFVPPKLREKIAKIPGRVRSRINLARCVERSVSGKCKNGWEHVLNEHLNSNKTGKSQFTISEIELEYLLQSPSVVAVIPEDLGSGAILQSKCGKPDRVSNRYRRVVKLPHYIGTDAKQGFKRTKILTVITDGFGNLLTAHPGGTCGN